MKLGISQSFSSSPLSAQHRHLRKIVVTILTVRLLKQQAIQTVLRIICRFYFEKCTKITVTDTLPVSEYY